MLLCASFAQVSNHSPRCVSMMRRGFSVSARGRRCRRLSATREGEGRGVGPYARRVRARRLGCSRRLGRSGVLRAQSLRSLRALRRPPSSARRLPLLACSPLAALPSLRLSTAPPSLPSLRLSTAPPSLPSLRRDSVRRNVQTRAKAKPHASAEAAAWGYVI